MYICMYIYIYIYIHICIYMDEEYGKSEKPEEVYLWMIIDIYIYICIYEWLITYEWLQCTYTYTHIYICMYKYGWRVWKDQKAGRGMCI
jgi:hypothetical protein